MLFQYHFKRCPPSWTEDVEIWHLSSHFNAEHSVSQKHTLQFWRESFDNLIQASQFESGHMSQHAGTAFLDPR